MRARPSRALWIAVALGIAVRVAYLVATRHIGFQGDELEYDAEGRFIAAGHLFWTALPYGVPHASAWKAPGYPLWVGGWYALAGHHPAVVRAAQIPFGVATIVLTWKLAGRLFGARAANAAALVVALYPAAFQYEELLYSESLATPLTLLVLVLATRRPAGARRALETGAVLGLLILIRPSSAFLAVGFIVAWVAWHGLRRGAALSAAALACAVLVVAPWTIRNAVVMHGFLPVSLQEAAAYGTFNATSAGDPVWPYAWRPVPSGLDDPFSLRHPLGDLALKSRLDAIASRYVSAHPESLAEAFFWNGITRLWDLRRPSRAFAEIRNEGRVDWLSKAGLFAYYVLLAGALLCLARCWRTRRRSLALACLALALATSVVFTIDSGTRYRASLEPAIAVLACGAVFWRPARRVA